MMQEIVHEFHDQEELSGKITIAKLLQRKRKFSIPSYQRGYRWRTENVVELLTDLYEFHTAPTSMYCLQPVVFKEMIDENGKRLRVVDGQQRLTTLKIILGLLRFDNVWEMCYEEAEDDEKSINSYFKNNTRSVADEWLKIGDRTEVLKKVLGCRSGKEVAFVGYYANGSEESDEHALFNRLNDGKVPLTSAELIKGLYSVDASGLSAQDKMEILKEWEQVESSLHNERLWRIFVSDDSVPFTRLELLFSIVSGTTQIERKTDALAVYHKFYRRIESGNRSDNLKDQWQEVLKLFWWMKSCASDVEIANYLGWMGLFRDVGVQMLHTNYCAGKLTEDRTSLRVTKEECERARTAKEEELGKLGCFRENLRLYIVEAIKSMFPLGLKDALYTYGDFTNAIKFRQLFVLLNALLCIRSKEVFRFDLYIAEQRRYLSNGDRKNGKAGWEIEHIQPHSKGIETGGEDTVNGIWNLTLLDGRTNDQADYKDKDFQSKRMIIQSHIDKVEYYVAPLTQRVFMRFYSPECTASVWDFEKDGVPYKKELLALFSEFEGDAK